jgi:hypothetical protein
VGGGEAGLERPGCLEARVVRQEGLVGSGDEFGVELLVAADRAGQGSNASTSALMVPENPVAGSAGACMM